MRRGPQGAGKVNKKLLLLRHARHAAADHHSLIGSTDIDLAEGCRPQAASVAAFIETCQPEVCLCSPLKRCIETIGRIPYPDIEIHSDLREVDFGEWEGMTFEQVRQTDPATLSRWANFDAEFAFPSGERLNDFFARVRRVADLMVSRPEKTILAVTHAGIIRALICHFLGLHPRQYVLFNIEFGSVASIDLFGDKGVLAGLNCHQLKGEA